MHKPTDVDALVAEAATALSHMRTVDDLHSRMGVLKDREEVETDRLAAFIVTMPEGYDAEDKAVFARYISDTLERLAEEAAEQVKFERTWNRLGEDA
jgi:hypothetical protein